MAGRVATYVQGFHLPAAASMPYRAFGASGRLVSAYSFGASALGSVFYDINESEGIETVRHAIRSGVNLVDAAPWYGFGKAETVLGKALQGVPREAYYLHTKVGRYTADLVTRFDFGYDRVTKSIDESLERLGVDYIDTIQVHDPEFAPSLALIQKETLPALRDAMAKGKVKSIGITGYPLQVIRDLTKLAEEARIPLTSAISYCRYTLHDQALVTSGTLQELQSKGLGIINASPLSMGLLTHRGPPEWHVASSTLKTLCRESAEWCAARNFDFSRLAMAFCFEYTGIPTTMGSAADRATLQANLDLVTGAKPLMAEERKALETVKEFLGSLGAHASWEGAEVNKYWIKMGKLLVEDQYKRLGGPTKAAAAMK